MVTTPAPHGDSIFDCPTSVVLEGGQTAGRSVLRDEGFFLNQINKSNEERKKLSEIDTKGLASLSLSHPTSISISIKPPSFLAYSRRSLINTAPALTLHLLLRSRHRQNPLGPAPEPGGSACCH